jgi:hypothetical protein
MHVFTSPDAVNARAARTHAHLLRLAGVLQVVHQRAIDVREGYETEWGGHGGLADSSGRSLAPLSRLKR